MNLARSRIISHPKGEKIQTPLLLPSFSSKGFYKVLNNDGNKYSLQPFYKLMGRQLGCEHLVSAYDIHKKYVSAEDIPSSNYVVIDSGGFECLDFVSKKKSWETCFTESDYLMVMQSLALDVNANFVTFDKQYLGLSVDKQLGYSLPLADKIHKQNQLVTILIKPSTSRIISISEIAKNVKSFKSFDVIGVTERELGLTVEEKVINLMRLRIILDDNLLNIPIHVFGCLEPIWIVLFYLSGAEMFDGLFWMSSYYMKEGFIRLQDTLLLKNKLNKTVTDEYLSLIGENMNSLNVLKTSLVNFFHTRDYGLFDDYNINYLSIINKMQKKVKNGR